MIDMINIGVSGAKLLSGAAGLLRSLPEPRSAIAKVANSLVDDAPSPEVDDSSEKVVEYSDLIMRQQEVQHEMMVFSMESNLLRTEHETSMAVVHNLRAS